MHTEARTRKNYDPEVMRLSGLLGPAIRDGAPAAEVAAIRKDLDRAKRLAAIRAAARNAPPLDPATLGSIVSLLAAAAVTE